MDTTGDLSADRIKHTLPAYAGLVSSLMQLIVSITLTLIPKATSTVLERLHISLAFDLPSAYDVLESIRSVFMVSLHSLVFPNPHSTFPIVPHPI